MPEPVFASVVVFDARCYVKLLSCAPEGRLSGVAKDM